VRDAQRPEDVPVAGQRRGPRRRHVIGLAFKTLVDALIADIITPVVAIPGGADFSGLEFTVNGSVFRYGDFRNAVISFVTVAPPCSHSSSNR
jgi:hypothetical protein